VGKYNFDMFQVPQDGVNGAWSQAEAQQSRRFDSRISNFGALKTGTRSSTDYTMIVNGFSDAVQNPRIPESIKDENPFVAGSAVKRIRNDEMMIMLLGSRSSINASLPNKDVMATNLTGTPSKDGTVPLNYPDEGYTPFGGRVAGPFNYRPSK